MVLSRYKISDKGWYLLKRLLVSKMCLTNKMPVSYLEWNLPKEFAEWILILVGEFNLTLEPSSDITFIVWSLETNLKKCLESFQLLGVWKVLQLTAKDYTYFSSPHSSYSRKDLFLVCHCNFPLIWKGKIGDLYMSDHALISREVKIWYEWSLAMEIIWGLDYGTILERKEKGGKGIGFSFYNKLHRRSFPPMGFGKFIKVYINDSLLKMGADRYYREIEYFEWNVKNLKHGKGQKNQCWDVSNTLRSL